MHITRYAINFLCKTPSCNIDNHAVCKLEEESLILDQVSPESDICLCPGDVVTYECTTIGGGSTVWKGSAFNDSCNEIILLHDRYNSPGAYYVSCLNSNETIVARGLPVEVNETYTSQLSVTLTASQFGKSIECRHDNGSSDTIVASIEISPGTINPVHQA